MAICLYGATGYTGKLVTDELVRRGADFVLGGRSRDKLERLSEERGQGAPVRVASIDDPQSLRAMLEGCEVLINCAGPFTLAGEPVVATAVETGTNYVDSTGEQPFMKMVFDRYGEKAERKGVALVPAMGFDYVPGDCIAHLAAEGHEPLDEIVLAYAVSGFGATIGTMRSLLEALKGGDFVYRDGDWRPAPGGIFRATFDFPEPIGRQVMTRYPSGEVITVPRHTDTRNVTSMLSAGGIAPLPALAPAVPFMMPGISLALRTPLRGLLSKAVGRLPVGPGEDDRKAARFTIVAQAKSSDGSSGTGTVRGSDPYGITAVTLVYGAERMAQPDYIRAGALGPAAAYDPTELLNYLGDHGVSWELDRGTAPKPRAAARTA